MKELQKKNIKIHDFRFETSYEMENGIPKILSAVVYYIGIEDFGMRLSSGGQTYVLDSYIDELQEKLAELVRS